MRTLLLSTLIFLATTAHADSFFIPDGSRDNVIGEVEFVSAFREDTLLEIARRNGLGYDEIIAANLKVNRWVPGEGTKIRLPRMFILPDAPRDGIVINLGELRLYYFAPPDDEGQVVHTFPISVGRMDWKSPLGKTRIAAKVTKPDWRPPKSIREEALAEGRELPEVILGGDPENPLGAYALRLGLPSYLIHGTDEKKEFGIGMRVTHGCIRMYPEDIERLFEMVKVGVPVYFVDQPVKAGWRGGRLFVEIHSPLYEDLEEFEAYSHRINSAEVLSVIARATDSEIDFEKIWRLMRGADGVPTAIAEQALPPPRR